MNQSAFIKVDKGTFYRFIAQAPRHERYEFVRGRIVQQQQGGTRRHGRIAARFAELCRRQIDVLTWVVLKGRGVETEQSIRYGDVVVEPIAGSDDSLSTKDPVFIVEVLSPTSGDRDLIEKPEEYLSLPSLQAYVIASQSERACLQWTRGSDGHWPKEPTGLGNHDAITIKGAFCLEIAVADIYRGIIDLPTSIG
jgi:Uma2 family endonuclease